jgi:DNA-binding GntR family transcriptional regulator
MTDRRKYMQIASALRGQLEDGTLKPGDSLAATSVAAKYGCARQTAVGAVRILAQEGRLERLPRSGYIVGDLKR